MPHFFIRLRRRLRTLLKGFLLSPAATKGKELSGRYMQCFLYTRAPGMANDHFYAHPLDMVVNLDMNSHKVRAAASAACPRALPGQWRAI